MRYSTEFKKNAVSMFKREGVTKTCRQLHVTRATVYHWVKRAEGESGDITRNESISIVEKGSQHQRNTIYLGGKK